MFTQGFWNCTSTKINDESKWHVKLDSFILSGTAHFFFLSVFLFLLSRFSVRVCPSPPAGPCVVMVMWLTVVMLGCPQLPVGLFGRTVTLAACPPLFWQNALSVATHISAQVCIGVCAPYNSISIFCAWLWSSLWLFSVLICPAHLLFFTRPPWFAVCSVLVYFSIDQTPHLHC